MQAFRRNWLRIAPIMLVCMIFGALAPQGFMPRFGPEGFSIILCSGSGQRTLHVAPGTAEYEKLSVLHAAMDTDHQDSDEDRTMPPCVFSTSVQAAVIDVPFTVAQPAPMPALAPALVAAIGYSRHRAATPPATGPPSLI